jgi:Flp pilus assembly protein TadG
MASRSTRNAVQSFGSDERGAVAIIFGFLIVVLCLITGLAVDMGRILMARTALVDASDAAGLAVGRALMNGSSLADAEKAGYAFFEANIKNVGKVGAASPVPTIVTSQVNKSVAVNATVNVPMTLMQVGGFKSVAVPVRSEVKFDLKDLEVGVAIDITGSMNTSINGERKIDSLKKSFETFVKTLIPEEPTVGRKVRIGVAPYAPAINLGTFASKASDNRSADGCVTERGTNSYSDFVPTGPNAFLVAKDGTKDQDPTQGKGAISYYCPTSRIVPLTDKRETLIDNVNKFNAGGFTAGHVGAQWAWNLVSEDYAGFWGGDSQPDAYSKVKDKKLDKAVVFMTDGVFNTAFHHDTSFEQAAKLCEAMKKRGVLVFTLGFGLDSEPDLALRKKAKDSLRACATPGPEYYVDASNAVELDTAFKQFAAVLGKLRIAK